MTTSVPHTRSHPRRRRAAGAFVLDLAAVFAFVVAGTRTHDTSTGPASVVLTAAPFVLGVVIGWAISRAWRRPHDIGTGAVVFGTTLGAGMAIRRMAFGDGTAAPFLVVAVAFLAVTLIGWRVVAAAVTRRVGRAPQVR